MHYVQVWTSNRKSRGREKTFREELERTVGVAEALVMMCVAGNVNAHVGIAEIGEENPVGKFGWIHETEGAGS